MERPNRRSFVAAVTSTLAALALLGACAGGDGPAPGIDRGGVQSAIASGRITGFGSVIVNGIRWSTTSAQIFIDDVAASEAELALGQVVRIEGTRTGDDGVATSIRAEYLIEGPIAVIDTAAGELIVLGQRVLVDERTVFSSNIVLDSLDGLRVGDFVKISGLIGTTGTLLATYVKLDDESEAKITGYVMNLDAGLLRFEINGTAVDYSAATVIDVPGGMPAEGMLVRVIGTYDSTALVFSASRIQARSLFDDDDDDDDFEIEVEGIVTRFATAQDFDVSGLPATTTAQTRFVHGTVNDLMLGERVELEGRLGQNGVLIAAEIEFRDRSSTGSGGGSTSGDDYQCPPSPVVGATIESNVNVVGVCVLDSVTVGGRVFVQPGSELTIVNSTIANDLQSLSAVSIDISGTTVGLNVDIKETSSWLRLVNVTTPHNIQLEKNQGQIHVENFGAGQDFQLKESIGDILVSGAAGQNAQLEKNQGGAFDVDVTVGQDAQVKENQFVNSASVLLTGGDQAQCLDNNFEAYAQLFESVDGCVPL